LHRYIYTERMAKLLVILVIGTSLHLNNTYRNHERRYCLHENKWWTTPELGLMDELLLNIGLKQFVVLDEERKFR